MLTCNIFYTTMLCFYLRGGFSCSSVFARPLSSARASFCLAITSSCRSPLHLKPKKCNSPALRFYNNHEYLKINSNLNLRYKRDARDGTTHVKVINLGHQLARVQNIQLTKKKWLVYVVYQSNKTHWIEQTLSNSSVTIKISNIAWLNMSPLARGVTNYS